MCCFVKLDVYLLLLFVCRLFINVLFCYVFTCCCLCVGGCTSFCPTPELLPCVLPPAAPHSPPDW